MAPELTAEQRQVDADMDTGEQSNSKMAEEAEEQQPGQQTESLGQRPKTPARPSHPSSGFLHYC